MNFQRILFFYVLAMLPLGVSAQYNIRIEAYVIDQQTNKPIPYANIGFVDNGVGTVSREDGWFHLLYDETRIQKTSTIQVSSIGYKTLSISTNEFYNLLTKDNKIYLQPQVEALEETIVYADKRVHDSIGYSSYHSNLMAYWKDKQALGGEIGSFIKLRQKNSKIHKLKFNILENSADSLLVRVNIYSERRGKPDKNLLRSNIYHTISNKKGEEVIDLTPYNIRLHEDFIVTLELIKVYGNNIQFAITANKNGKAYMRYVSQDAWKRLYKTGIAFKIETSYSISEKANKEREKPDHITMYWDTSLSMLDRDMEKEKEVLKNYFSVIGDVQVDLIPFSNNLQNKQIFGIKKGNSKELIAALEKLTYNGASDFSILFPESLDTDLYIVATDGFANYGDHKSIYNVPVFYMNSKDEGSHIVLQEAGQHSDGFYLHLPKINTSQALRYMLYDTVDKNIYGSNATKEFLSGEVYANQSPIQGCTVRIKDSFVETETNAKGEFVINAQSDDVLVFEHFGMVRKEIPVDGIKDIKIDLIPKYNTLDEVNIKSDKTNKDEEVVNRGDQKVKKRRVGNATYTLTNEDFPKSAIFLSDLIRGRFPGVQVIGTGDQVTYRVRGRRSISLSIAPLFVVDGVQYNQAPNFLQPSNIKSISLTSGLAGTAKYGAAGAGGVFVIETGLGSLDLNSSTDVDSLLVKGNDYNESVFLLDVNQNKPEYLNDLLNSSTYPQALSSYYKLRKEHISEIPFYIYAAEYFMVWDEEFSEQVLSTIAEVAYDNYKALRSLAFKLEQIRQLDQAVFFYKKLLELKPNYAQSYVDLARIYTENENYIEAFDLYKVMLANNIDTVNFEEIGEQLTSQLRSFMNNHRSQVSYTEIPEEYLKVKSIPVRIVFDWNDPKAAFELQFVSPNKKYFNWSHAYEDQPEVLLKELEQGVFSKEFILDESFKGQWIVNIKILEGDISPINPVIMKYTIYKNYGLPEETKEMKFIKLYNQEEKVSLDKFTI